MNSNKTRLARVALAAALFVAGSAMAADVDGKRLLDADKELAKGNWLTYHGSYKSWHYSPLDQINTKNVSKMTEAWSHTASRPTAACKVSRSLSTVCSITRAPTTRFMLW